MKDFVVIDHEGNPSYNTKKEAPERFATHAAAEKRARELASYAPGEVIGVYRIMTEVIAPVGRIETKKRGV